MTGDGLNISTATYNLMIHTCVRAGNVGQAEEYLKIMEQSGVGTDVVTYNLVIFMLPTPCCEGKL